MVVQQGVSSVLHQLLSKAFQLHRKMSKIQQFPLSHENLSIDFVSLNKLFVLSDPFSKKDGLVRLVMALETNSSKNAGTIFYERNWQTETDEANFLQFCGLLNIHCLLAEWEALFIVFDEVRHNEHMFEIELESPFRLELHDRAMRSDGKGAILVDLNCLEAFLISLRNSYHSFGFKKNPFHRVILFLHIILQFVLLTKLFQVDSILHELLTLLQKEVNDLLIKKFLELLCLQFPILRFLFIGQFHQQKQMDNNLFKNTKCF